MFVIQWRIHEWDKWTTRSTRYPTIGEARKAFDKLPYKTGCRIAEEYTVVRYKAVSDGK
jgi:hypothetical protein